MDINELDLALVFHDVKPIPQDDGPQTVCAIDYPPLFVETMSYLRAVLQTDEHTERTLNLTSICLQQNPANYTTWHFRRRILATLTSSSPKKNIVNATSSDIIYYDPDRVKTDLALASKLGGVNPKNYQIWYHRQSVLTSLVNDDDEVGLKWAHDELEYTANVFENDPKNYHSWSHRQWIVRQVNNEAIWESELVYADKLIMDDIRNNSAWNHRWFITHRAKKFPPMSVANSILEADYAIHIAEMDPFNESPWRYLIGILKEQYRSSYLIGKDDGPNAPSSFIKLLNQREGEIIEMKYGLQAKCGADGNSCVNLISALIDVLEAKADCSSGDKNVSCEKAASFAHSLATEHDPIRKKYWLFREKELKLKIKK